MSETNQVWSDSTGLYLYFDMKKLMIFDMWKHIKMK